MLGGRPIDEHPLHGTTERLYVIRCRPTEILAAWQAARSVVDQTGHWPIAVFGWEEYGGLDFLAEVAAPRGNANLPDAGEVLAELASWRDQPLRIPGYWERQLEWELEHTRSHVGSAPTPEEVARFLDGRQSSRLLDRYLLDWEVAHLPLDRWPPARADHLNFFVPPEPCAVVLLPVLRPEETLGYVFAYDGGMGARSAERLMAIVGSWHRRFGAELWANWVTMVEFVVSRPPTTIEEAWQLADEQALVAPCTTQLPGVPLRRHAQALLGRDTWFLHERP